MDICVSSYFLHSHSQNYKLVLWEEFFYALSSFAKFFFTFEFFQRLVMARFVSCHDSKFWLWRIILCKNDIKSCHTDFGSDTCHYRPLNIFNYSIIANFYYIIFSFNFLFFHSPPAHEISLKFQSTLLCNSLTARSWECLIIAVK